MHIREVALPLLGKRGLIAGIANESGMAFGCRGNEWSRRHLLERMRQRTPGHQLVNVEDVANVVAFLAGGSAALSGNIEYIDRGYHVVG